MRSYRKRIAIGFVAALAFAIAGLVPLPGPGGNEVCGAYGSGDRSQLRDVVDALRYSDMTLLERLRESTTPLASDAECLLREFGGRSELPRFCRRMLPATQNERDLRSLHFRRALLESQIECLERLRRERIRKAE